MGEHRKSITSFYRSPIVGRVDASSDAHGLFLGSLSSSIQQLVRAAFALRRQQNRGAMMYVLGIVPAGGGGERLYPLTAPRAKPAVPFGGRYRIVDFVLSNF